MVFVTGRLIIKHVHYNQSDRHLSVAFHSKFTSKHLKGQLVPPVSDVTFLGPKEVSWSPPVSDVTFFGPKEVSWSPLSVT